MLSESKKAGGPKEFEARAKHHKAVENRFGKDYATLEDAPEGLSDFLMDCLNKGSSTPAPSGGVSRLHTGQGTGQRSMASGSTPTLPVFSHGQPRQLAALGAFNGLQTTTPTADFSGGHSGPGQGTGHRSTASGTPTLSIFSHGQPLQLAALGAFNGLELTRSRLSLFSFRVWGREKIHRVCLRPSGLQDLSYIPLVRVTLAALISEYSIIYKPEPPLRCLRLYNGKQMLIL